MDANKDTSPSTPTWVLLSFGIIGFAFLVGFLGGVLAGDATASGFSIVVLAAVGAYAVNKGRQAGVQ